MVYSQLDMVACPTLQFISSWYFSSSWYSSAAGVNKHDLLLLVVVLLLTDIRSARHGMEIAALRQIRTHALAATARSRADFLIHVMRLQSGKLGQAR